MTKIYKLRYEEGFEWLLPAREADIERLRFEGQPYGPLWKPVEMKRLKVWDNGETLRPTDFPACSGGDMLILGVAASEKLGPALAPYGELLPLAGEGKGFQIFNVTRLIDALDVERSKVLRATDDGSILRIKQHSFVAERLQDSLIFKLSNMRRGLVYVAEQFVQIVEDSKLTGVGFQEVWSQEGRSPES